MSQPLVESLRIWVSLKNERGDGFAAGSESLGSRARWECLASPQVQISCSSRESNRPVNEVVDARIKAGLNWLKGYDLVGCREHRKVEKESNSRIVWVGGSVDNGSVT